jgi:hypothetical protein
MNDGKIKERKEGVQIKSSKWASYSGECNRHPATKIFFLEGNSQNR